MRITKGDSRKVLRMAQQQYIKDLWENEDLSLREISRQTGFSFQTVQKYAYQEDWSKEKLPDLEPSHYPVLEEYIPVINEWLEADQKVPRKQRHTAKRISDRLVEEHGYTGSYSSVRRYVHKKKVVMRNRSQGFLPLEQPEGWGQVDFGKCRYQDAQGQEATGYELVVSFPYSDKGYVQFFPSQNQECLLTGLQRIFAHIGGVPIRLRFDNMSTAVAQVLEGSERVLTDSFRRFMLHYRFQADFCNPAAGNEKGNVENKVGYIRRNVFVPIPTITSFEDFNSTLWEWSEKDAQREHYRKETTIQSLWETEQKALLPLPKYPFPVYRYETVSLNKYGFATVDTNKYGLSPALSGEKVQVKIFFDHIEFYHDHQLAGQYPRSYGHNVEFYNWTQYIGILCRKPGAAEHTRFFRQMPQQWKELLCKAQGKERRSALQLLSEIVQDGNEKLCEDAIVLAKENGRTDSDSIRQCYYMIARKEFRPEPLRLRSETPELNYNPDLAVYDSLTGGEYLV